MEQSYDIQLMKKSYWQLKMRYKNSTIMLRMVIRLL
jgi:uncharacterized protein YegP (UPF0339 family)